MKRMIAREGLIFLGVAILYLTTLWAALSIHRYSVLLVWLCYANGIILWGYICYLPIRFSIWAIKILRNKED